MPKKGAKTYDTSLEECARKLGLEIVSNSSQLPTTYAMRNKQAHVPSTPLFAEKPPPGLTPGEEVEYKGLWASTYFSPNSQAAKERFTDVRF